MSSYVEKVLLPGEHVVYIAYLHWIVYVHGLTLTVCGATLSFFSNDLVTLLFGPALAQHFAKFLAMAACAVTIFGILLVMMAYIQQTSTELVVTNHRLIAKYGFVSRTTFEIIINRVAGVNFDQTVLGRMLGFGTIYVRGMGNDISPFDNISSPERFHTALMSVVEGVRK